jgi:hypothetical protein
MRRTDSLAVLSAAVTVFFASIASAAPTTQAFYDYTRGINSDGLVGRLEVGHNVSLDTPAVISELAVAISAGSPIPVTTELQVRIYAGDGLDSPPGQLIWSAVVGPSITITQQIVVEFDVPNVIVPRQFFWTVEQLSKESPLKYHWGLLPDSSDNFGIIGGRSYRYEGDWYVATTQSQLAMRASGYFIPEPTALSGR